MSLRAYTEADIRLLASMDERHGRPSGTSEEKTRKLAASARKLAKGQ